MTAELYHWVIFNCLIIGLLFLDLWYFHRKPHIPPISESLLITAIWIALALLFNGWIYQAFGSEAALSFLTGYLLEKSLSIDNLFLFLLIFSRFRVPEELKHHVLFFGILGAIVMRALLIWGGITLIHYFDWIFYLFGAFLIFTGFRLMTTKEKEIQQEKNLAYRILSYWIPMTSHYHGKSFFIKQKGKWVGTPLLVSLVLIETADLIFAFDSIPAILAITTDPFLVYTSNIFAILGLRSLFFALEGVMQRFYLFHYALSVILIFIGFKMIAKEWIPISTLMTLGILMFLILAALMGSLWFPQKTPKKRNKSSKSD
jgi:tellurite resistance protein TerC